MKSRLLKSLLALSVLAGLALLGWVSYGVTRYLRNAALFEVNQISVTGVKRLQETHVVAAADFQSGVNIFSVDMDEMRDRVERMRGVRHALVQRVLPDQIVIKVFERQPAGAALIKGEIFEFDDQAVLLEPGATSGDFAVLYGLKTGDREGNLKKVGLYRKVIEDLDAEALLSEIHINDAGEVSVVSTDVAQIVDLGAADLQDRWMSYLRLKPTIESQFPNAVRVDLRFRDQVIVKMDPEDVEEGVVWRAEKNSL